MNRKQFRENWEIIANGLKQIPQEVPVKLVTDEGDIFDIESIMFTHENGGEIRITAKPYDDDDEDSAVTAAITTNGEGDFLVP